MLGISRATRQPPRLAPVPQDAARRIHRPPPQGVSRMIRYGTIIGATTVLLVMLGAAIGLLLAMSTSKAQTRAIVIHANGRVDIDWRAVEFCQTDLCRVARAARCN